MEYFRKTSILGALEKMMFDDQLFDHAKSKEPVVFDGTSRETTSREENLQRHLARAFQAESLFAKQPQSRVALSVK